MSDPPPRRGGRGGRGGRGRRSESGPPDPSGEPSRPRRERSGASARERRDQYLSDMRAEEANYQPDSYSAEVADGSSGFIDIKSASATILKRLLDSYAEDIHSQGRPFTPSACNLESLPKNVPQFEFPSLGIGSLYVKSKDEFQTTFFSGPDRGRLAAHLSAIQNLTAAIGTTLDAASDSGLELLIELAKVVISGAVYRPKQHFAALIERLDADILSVPQLSKLRLAIAGAKGGDDVTGLQYAVRTVYGILQDGQLASLFEYFAEFGVFREQFYFADAPVQDRQFCRDLAEIVQDIAFVTFKNQVKLSSVPKSIPAVPVPQLIVRVNGAVDLFLRSARRVLVGGEKLDLTASGGVLAKALGSVLLESENGEIAGSDGIVAVLEEVAKKLQRVAALLVEPDRKPGVLLYGVLANGLAGEVVAELVGISHVRHVDTPAYWKAGKEIAEAFRSLGDAPKAIDQRRFVEQVNAWG